MTTTLRKNTFIISEPAGPPVPNQSTGMDKQNQMRLKVNRIALVQELKVEHILGALMKHGIVSEHDFRKIESGRTPQDRARILIDILPTKSKDSEWYKCFRDALLCPEGGTNVRHRYRNLVEFLDNTMIHRPTSQAGKFSDVESRSSRAQYYSRYQPLPQINEKQNESNVTNVLRLEDDRDGGGADSKQQQRDYMSVATNDMDKMSMVSADSRIPAQGQGQGQGQGQHRPMMLVKGFFHQWIPTPDNFKSLIELPKDLCQSLEDVGTVEAVEQLRHEQLALQHVRRLEVIAALARRRQLPSGFELCMCDAVQEFLGQPQLYHLYLKHLRSLQQAGVNIPKDMVTSYTSTLDMMAVDPQSSLIKQVVDLGFRLVDLLMVLELWSMAQDVLNNIITLLRANPAVENWIDEFKAHVRLMSVCNDKLDLRGAQSAYFAASQVQYQIQMMSFGQQLIFEGRLYQELSALMLEFGSIQTAHGWSKKALKELDQDNPYSVVEVVTQAVMTYSAMWLVQKAETLAVFAVQYALDKFGKYHPMYLKALSSLCHVCNEFKQDTIGLQLATDLLKTAELTYGCETLQVASAHRTLSKALMAQQSFHTSDSFYSHAMEAVRIARSHLKDDPLLVPYLTNFAMALQWKSLHCPKEVQGSTLHWAETEAKHALNIVIDNYGDISLRSAQIHTLLGQIYSKMTDMAAAERHLVMAVDYLKLCQPTVSNHLLLAHATLALFLTMLGHNARAIPHLMQVIMYVESSGYYLKWVHVCFQTLIGLLQMEGASYANIEEADRLQVHLSLWLKDNPKDDSPVDTRQLQEAPPLFKDFLDKFDTWASAISKVQNLKDTMKTAAIFGAK